MAKNFVKKKEIKIQPLTEEFKSMANSQQKYGAELACKVNSKDSLKSIDDQALEWDDKSNLSMSDNEKTRQDESSAEEEETDEDEIGQMNPFFRQLDSSEEEENEE